jgi:hypothetical protein
MLRLYWVAITKEGMATYLSTRPLTNTKEGVAAPAWLSLGQISFLALLTPIYMKFSFALRSCGPIVRGDTSKARGVVTSRSMVLKTTPTMTPVSTTKFLKWRRGTIQRSAARLGMMTSQSDTETMISMSELSHRQHAMALRPAI